MKSLILLLIFCLSPAASSASLLQEEPLAGDSLAGKHLAAVTLPVRLKRVWSKTEKKYVEYLQVLMTRRTPEIRYANQVVYPGGQFDYRQDKSLSDAALRETAEEIGFQFNQEHILGYLPFVETADGRYKTLPVIVDGSGISLKELTLNPSEVSEAQWVFVSLKAMRKLPAGISIMTHQILKSLRSASPFLKNRLTCQSLLDSK